MKKAQGHGFTLLCCCYGVVLLVLLSASSVEGLSLKVLPFPVGTRGGFLTWNSPAMDSVSVGVGDIAQYCQSASLVYNVRVSDLTIQGKGVLTPSAYQNFGYSVNGSLFIATDNENLFQVALSNQSVVNATGVNDYTHGDIIYRGFLQYPYIYFSTYNQYGTYVQSIDTRNLKESLIFNAMDMGEVPLIGAASMGPNGDTNAYWLNSLNTLRQMNMANRTLLRSYTFPGPVGTVAAASGKLYVGSSSFDNRLKLYEFDTNRFAVSRVLNITTVAVNYGITFIQPSSNGSMLLVGAGNNMVYIISPITLQIIRTFNLSGFINGTLSSHALLDKNTTYAYLLTSSSPPTLAKLFLNGTTTVITNTVIQSNQIAAAPSNTVPRAASNYAQQQLYLSSSPTAMALDATNGWIFVSTKPYLWKIAANDLSLSSSLDIYGINNQVMSAFTDSGSKSLFLFRGRYTTKSILKVDEGGFCNTTVIPEGNNQGGSVVVVDRKTRTAFYPLWTSPKIAKLSLNSLQVLPQVLTLNTTESTIRFMVIDESSRTIYVGFRGIIVAVNVDSFKVINSYPLPAGFSLASLAVLPSNAGTRQKGYLYAAIANSTDNYHYAQLLRLSIPGMNYAGVIGLGTFGQNWDQGYTLQSILNPTSKKLFVAGGATIMQINIDSFKLEGSRDFWQQLLFFADANGIAFNQYVYMLFGSNYLIRFQTISDINTSNIH